jgi:glycosyltransferase involved in cell wall biosynthesis
LITANFFHIKSTNGLFFYGIDYLREHLDLVRVVLVRPALEQAIRGQLTGTTVTVCSPGRYIKEVAKASWRGDLLFTPTSHPLPGIHRQWIVLHDAYPFQVGPKSGLKHRLLRWSLRMSCCHVGYINRSDALPFVASLGVSPQRMIFAPNRFPTPAKRTVRPASADGVTFVGLLGTDSAKKNYDRLFAAVLRGGIQHRLAFRVYGHDTPYIRDIRAAFPELHIELARSDDESLDTFMSHVDVLTSAAEQEGFGRPIASALLAGMPVHLLDRPVFREFFSGGAQFHTDVDTLACALPRSAGAEAPLGCYVAPADVIQAYADAGAEIRRLSASATH